MSENNKTLFIYVIGGILTVAVVILFVLYFKVKPASGEQIKPPTQTQLVTLDDGTVVQHEVPLLPIAYIQSDSIFTLYGFFIDQSEALQKKYADEFNSLQSRDRKIQEDYAKLQQDVQNNRYLTQSEVEQKSISLQRRAEELQRMAGQIDQDQRIQMQTLSTQLTDSIKNAIDIINVDKKYQVIFLNEGLTTILYAEKTYDLTEEVLELLNARYKKPE